MVKTSIIRWCSLVSLIGCVVMAHAIVDAPPVSAASNPDRLPEKVDLRPRFKAFKLAPRVQGARGTCSIFTTCVAIEFAIARRDEGQREAVRLSPEFLNWAAGEVAGRPSDGNFFHNAIAGFEKHGLCAEDLMPYVETFDAARKPSEEAIATAASVRDAAKNTIKIRWIVPWQASRFGVNEDQFAEIKRALASGYPVAAGSGHSRLLVGYRDDAKVVGGGKFITLDSALNRFDEVTYEFVRTEVADVFWVEAVKPE